MKNYGITWTDADGTRRASGVSYDKPSADDRKKQIEAEVGDAEAAAVDIVEVKPGELPQA